MSARDLLRAAVVTTNPYWPFSRLNRVPYYLAIRAFLQLCRRFPEIRSVYLRHGLLEDHWVPAISDIDLTLIIRSDLTMEEEFTFLHAFWRNHDRLMKIFPMLQDIVILNDEQIASWTKFSILGYESRDWRLLHGVETVESEYMVVPARLDADGLNYALRFYLGYFLPKFYQDGPLSLRSQQLQRLARKILQYANYSSTSDRDGLVADRRFRDEADTVACVIKGLEERIPNVDPPTSFASSGNNIRRMRNGVEVAAVGSDDQGVDTRGLTVVSEAIDGVLQVDGAYTVVLKDGLEEAVIKNCVEVTRRVLQRPGTTPVIVSGRIFEHMLRFYAPPLYTQVATRGKVVHGRDVLADIRPPDRRAVMADVLERVPFVLKFPRRRQLMSTPGLDGFRGSGVDWMLRGSLLVKLYLEAGMTEPTRAELVAESRKRYPEDYRRLEEIREESRRVGDEVSRRRLFSLFAGLARDIDYGIRDCAGLEGLWVRGR